MTLKEKIDAYKKQFRSTVPKDIQAVMVQATEDLQNSGILENTIKVGDRAPNFTLLDMNEDEISLEDLLSQEFLVLGFYRGKW
jgi:hypothetical protein